MPSRRGSWPPSSSAEPPRWGANSTAAGECDRHPCRLPFLPQPALPHLPGRTPHGAGCRHRPPVSCPYPTSISSSPCRRRSPVSPSRTAASCSRSCAGPPPRPSPPSPPIPNASASASVAPPSSIPGTSASSSIPTCIASSQCPDSTSTPVNGGRQQHLLRARQGPGPILPPAIPRGDRKGRPRRTVTCRGSRASLQRPGALQKHLDEARHTEWVVYAKGPFAGPESLVPLPVRYHPQSRHRKQPHPRLRRRIRRLPIPKARRQARTQAPLRHPCACRQPSSSDASCYMPCPPPASHPALRNLRKWLPQAHPRSRTKRHAMRTRPNPPPAGLDTHTPCPQCGSSLVSCCISATSPSHTLVLDWIDRLQKARAPPTASTTPQWSAIHPEIPLRDAPTAQHHSCRPSRPPLRNRANPAPTTAGRSTSRETEPPPHRNRPTPKRPCQPGQHPGSRKCILEPPLRP